MMVKARCAPIALSTVFGPLKHITLTDGAVEFIRIPVRLNFLTVEVDGGIGRIRVGYDVGVVKGR